MAMIFNQITSSNKAEMCSLTVVSDSASYVYHCDESGWKYIEVYLAGSGSPKTFNVKKNSLVLVCNGNGSSLTINTPSTVEECYVSLEKQERLIYVKDNGSIEMVNPGGPI